MFSQKNVENSPLKLKFVKLAPEMFREQMPVIKYFFAFEKVAILESLKRLATICSSWFELQRKRGKDDQEPIQ